MTQSAPPFALFIRGSKDAAFEISDQLGFDAVMPALAVSIFEDGPGKMHVQALFETQELAQACKAGDPHQTLIAIGQIFILVFIFMWNDKPIQICI